MAALLKIMEDNCGEYLGTATVSKQASDEIWRPQFGDCL